MNLTRMGHYYVPSTEPEAAPENGNCLAAIVAHVWSDGMVNLAVFDRFGELDRRTRVDVAGPDGAAATFHLSQDCPWKR